LYQYDTILEEKVYTLPCGICNMISVCWFCELLAFIFQFVSYWDQLLLSLRRTSLGVYATWLQINCMNFVKLWGLSLPGVLLCPFSFFKFQFHVWWWSSDGFCGILIKKKIVYGNCF
jgi:hypothetical protein